MTTQEKQTLAFTFNEFTELDAGWYDRMKLWEDFVMSVPDSSNKYKNSDEEQRAMKRHYALKRKVEGVLFERCDKPEELRAYLNTLPNQKGFSFIRETLMSIGFLNPVSPN